MLYVFAAIGVGVCVVVGIILIKAYFIANPVGQDARAFSKAISSLKGMSNSEITHFLSEVVLWGLIGESIGAIPPKFFRHDRTFPQQKRMMIMEALALMRDDHKKNNRSASADVMNILVLSCFALEYFSYRKLGCRIWAELRRGLPGLSSCFPDLVKDVNDLYGYSLKNDFVDYSEEEIIPTGLRIE